MDSASGAHVQRYELVECIARGGMGEVFRGHAFGAHGFKKDVAIKRILPGLGGNQVFEQRFISEAKLAVTLTHANIVQVLDFGHDGDALFIAMEYVDGCDLRTAVIEQRLSGQPIGLGAVMHIAIAACNGLEFAHERGVLHRDVSPANILLSRAGEIKIADFGLAKAQDGGLNLTAARQIFGKAPYMSPEQTRGEQLDRRSDVWALAVVLHELITGRQLFDARRPDHILVAVSSGEIPVPSSLRPDLPAAFDDILIHALQRDRALRYQTCDEMGQALTEACFANGLVHTPKLVAELVAEITPAPPLSKPPTVATEADLETHDTTQTFIRTEITAEGLARFERTSEQQQPPLPPTPVPAPRPGDSLPPKKGRRALVIVVVLAIAVVAGVAVAMLVYDPGPNTAANASSDAAPASADAASAPVDASAPVAPDAAPVPQSADAAPAPLPADAAPARPDARTRTHDKPKFGTIAINVDPWAHVYFHGKKVGTTPIRALKLPYGKHRLELVNPELGREKTVRVTVPSDRSYSFSL